MPHIEQTDVKQMSIPKIILYHLLPGIPVFLLAGLFSFGAGLDMTISFIMAIAVGLIPVQLLIIHLTAKKQNRRFRDIVSFTEKLPFPALIVWAIPCIVIGWLAFNFLGGIESSFWSGLLGETPVDSYMHEATGITVLPIIIVMTFIFNGFLGPITEEIYFRGFLLPRMKVLGKAAPAVNAILFSLYHFFSLGETMTRIIGLMPLSYAVWYKKNIYIGIVVHCTLNIVGMIITFIF